MIHFIHSSLIEQKESLNSVISHKSIQNSKYIGIVKSITSVNELEQKTLRELLKEKIRSSREKLSNCKFEIINVCYIQIPIMEFSDKQISIIKLLKQDFDLVLCNSYSNTMLTQLISKKVCHIICNVFSQELVNRFDFIHHFNSGINHILSNEMAQKEMILGVELSIFQNISELKQAKYISSCIQNSKITTKSKVPHLLFKIIHSQVDLRDEIELIAIQKVLFNAQPFQVQNQKKYLEEFIQTQLKIKRGELIK